MSFDYLKNKFKKKNSQKHIEGSIDDVIFDAQEGEASQANEEKIEELEEKLNNTMAQLSEVENEIPRIKMGIDTLKSQIQEIRGDIDSLDKTIKDVMMLYEVVSEEINPFKDTRGNNPILSEIQELKEAIEELKTEIAQIKADLKLISTRGVDLDSLIYDVLSEGYE
ncbi:hypothetical protein PAP_04450 [Palaeococcus pacificus DY20341]|uniref:Flagellar protein FlaC n=1 Tax=Palaeococcus pacificus DY20341 TaxID=1343739 RepID=A0A075LT53_9EURY|nr:flagella accessory protein C [Palaeococcus pacificus]AIF69301.1 hypothetical protein PAP_04450 [Palaeococcus pacificus DY20341]